MKSKLQICLICLVAFYATNVCAANSKGNTLDLIIVRSFVGATEYERFHIEGSNMWYECGEVTDQPRTDFQPLTGDTVLPPNARLRVTQRRTKRLSQSEEKQLAKVATKVFAIDYEKHLLPPGAIFGLAGAGIASLDFENASGAKQIVASVDEVSDGTSAEVKQLRGLIEGVRGMGEILCEHKTFFGIVRK